ncbi:hypothetical protein ADUPG1_010224 [Aduncisulcus paluster]|uniref:Gag-pol polyprotein n=1 Tax=Aduncisulcus paluster TaxID=2918883 RepID=A0ABQ5JV96_9EUKA|nr:hypothetical protein ADUPG1_010224 [Aduncisulcus paluster]
MGKGSKAKTTKVTDVSSGETTKGKSKLGTKKSGVIADVPSDDLMVEHEHSETKSHELGSEVTGSTFSDGVRNNTLSRGDLGSTALVRRWINTLFHLIYNKLHYGNSINTLSMQTNKDSITILQPPYLREFDSKKWLQFQRDLRVYEARGGSAEWTTLVEPSLLKSLRLTAQIAEEATGTDLQEALTKKFAATTTQAYYDQLKALRLDILSATALVKFTADFQEIVDRHPDFGDDEHVTGMYLRGLKIPRLSERTRSEIDTAGKKDDLTFAMRQAFTELEEMVAIKDEVLKHATSFGLSVPQSGKLGHKAFECRTSSPGVRPGQQQGKPITYAAKANASKGFAVYLEVFKSQLALSGVKFMGLIDSGAELNFISESEYEKLDPNHEAISEGIALTIELTDGSRRKVSTRVSLFVNGQGHG